ncbi:MAG: acyl-CoA reductase [Polyangiales bacterium]
MMDCHGWQPRLQALRRAAAALCGAEPPWDAAWRRRLSDESGLSLPMVAWALESTLAAAESGLAAELDALYGAAVSPTSPRVAPAGKVLVVLASNVCTAAWRAIALPWLVGNHVWVRAAAGHACFAAAVVQALHQAAPGVHDSLVWHETPAGLDAYSHTAQLAAEVDLLSVYGSDSTVTTLRAACAAATRVVAHGHGLGVAYLPPGSLCRPEAAQRWLHALAQDIAAYDQRGCLSPQWVYIDKAAGLTPEAVAAALHGEALPTVERNWPRGPLPLAAATPQWRWRAWAVATGTLHACPTHAVAVQNAPAVARAGPGWRHIVLCPVADPGAWLTHLKPLGAHLKAVGIAGDTPLQAKLRAALPAPLAPRITALGQMQTPSWDAAADGQHPLWPYVRVCR